MTLPPSTKEAISQKLCPDVIANIMTQMKEMEERLNSKIDEIKKDNRQPKFTDIMQSDRPQAKVNSTNKLIKTIVQQNETKKKILKKKVKRMKELLWSKNT